MTKKSRVHTSQNQNKYFTKVEKNWCFQSTYRLYHSKIVRQLNRWQRKIKVDIKIGLPINLILYLLLSRTSSERIGHVLKAWIKLIPLTSLLCRVSIIPNSKIQTTYMATNSKPISLKSLETIRRMILQAEKSAPLLLGPTLSMTVSSRADAFNRVN